MAKTKHQKFAKILATFLGDIERDYENVRDRSANFSDSHVDDSFYDFWLRCETAKDRQNRFTLEAAAHESDEKAHAIYYEQYQRQDSQLWKNFDTSVEQVYNDWLMECPYLTNRGHRGTIYKYPFASQEDEPLKNALRKAVDFIKTKPSRHFRDLAHSYYQNLVEFLFEGTGIRTPVSPKEEMVPAYGLKILRDLNFSLETAKSWEGQKFLKLLPGRYPISCERAQAYLTEISSEFLVDPLSKGLLGETLLFIWVALSCAHYRRRFCTVADVMKVKESDLLVHRHQPWHGYMFLPTYSLKIEGENVPISPSLAMILLEFSDQRTKFKPIITVDRSSIEGYLRSATIKLGFDPISDPVTPETFLERPHHFGKDFRYHLKKT